METPIDCPHCGTKNVAALVKAITATGGRNATMLMLCKDCLGGVSATVQTDRSAPPTEEMLVYLKDEYRVPEAWKFIEYFPKPPQPRTVEHLDPRVHSALTEAEMNYSDRRWPSAATSYRLTVERCLKVLHPKMVGSIYERVKVLHDRHEIPTGLRHLCDSIRFFGSVGAHDLDDPTHEDVTAARDFTILLLTYLVELPERVRLAEERREAAKAR